MGSECGRKRGKLFYSNEHVWRQRAGRQEKNISELEVVAVAASAPFWSCLLADVDPTNQLGRT